MLATILRLVSKHDYVWLSIDSFSRRRLSCLSLLLFGFVTCQPVLAVQNDVSVLVTEDSGGKAASNAQVELAVELPRASSSKASFNAIPVSTRPFAPPLPPASMLADSGSVAKFRSSTRGTLTASSAPTSDEQTSVLSKAASSSPSLSSGGQTFASRLPSGSNLQTDKAFGSSPVSSDLRFNEAGSSTPRNRFGDFGASPAPKTENRFAFGSPAPGKSAASSPPAAPPVQPASSRFAPLAKSDSPARSATTQNRFGSSTSTPPATSNRFSSPAPPASVVSKAQLPKVDSPNSSRLPVAQPITTPPITKAPQATAQSLLAPNTNAQSSRFSANPGASSSSGSRIPAAPNRFANPPVNKAAASESRFGSPTTTRPGQPKSFGGNDLRNSSGLATRSAINSRSDSNKSAAPMIRRQSSSPTRSFSDASGSSQSSVGNSRLSSQSGQFGNQPKHTPLRGRPIENNLRGDVSRNQAAKNQGIANGSRSSDKVDRQSISFAQQQLRSIQAASADEDGTPVKLMEMFSEPLSDSQRKKMVSQYWETYYDMAALKIAIDYEKWLSSISTSTGAEKGLLSAAQHMAADGQLAAEIQLGKSQSRLLDFMPNPRPNGFAPLPSDEPLVERYVTDYEKYKRVRSLPTSLRGIDPMLASTLKLITRRAATVSTAKKAADQAGQAVRNRQIPVASAIAAGRIWRDSQLDMVASTVSYNQAISDFVLTLEPNRSPEQLTTFMLGASKAGSQSTATGPGSQSVLQPTRSANQQLQGFTPNRPTQFR